MYELLFALLVKMQIELASHLKRQRCENCKLLLSQNDEKKTLLGCMVIVFCP